MKTPKERLKGIYDEYLAWKENNKGRHFYQYLASNKYTLAFITVLKIQKQLAEECGFSTISECRKAINELENPNKHLEDSLNAIDKVIKENPEKVGEIVKRIKKKYDTLSDSKTEFSEEEIDKAWNNAATQMGGYKEETWQDILNEFTKFGKGKLGDWLIKNFKTPERL